jgi:hypothetical protein
MSQKLKFAQNRAQLAPLCPCGKSNHDGKYAPLKDNPNFGKCHSCDRFIMPTSEVAFKPYKPLPTSFISSKILTKSREKATSSNFAKWLLTLNPKAEHLIKRYAIGYYKKWGHDVVFWQIDFNGLIRTGKIMAYESTGSRIRHKTAISWMHCELELPDFNLSQCLFGEHLLKGSRLEKVAIVESEKTALIAAIYYPKVIWLATGGKSNLKIRPDLLKVLRGKQVTLYPDAGEFEVWKVKSEKYSFKVNENIEKMFLEGYVEKGFDLADWIINEKGLRNKRKP